MEEYSLKSQNQESHKRISKSAVKAIKAGKYDKSTKQIVDVMIIMVNWGRDCVMTSGSGWTWGQLRPQRQL